MVPEGNRMLVVTPKGFILGEAAAARQISYIEYLKAVIIGALEKEGPITREQLLGLLRREDRDIADEVLDLMIESKWIDDK